MRSLRQRPAVRKQYLARTQYDPSSLDVNLQPVKAKVDGASKRIRVCTSCIKSGKIVKG